MAIFDVDARRVVVRVVYDGPGMAGKTTNLQQLCRFFTTFRRSELYSPDASSGRTTYLDWLQIDSGLVGGYPLRSHFITVPGQAVLARRRFQLLEVADVVVFVAESTANGIREAAPMLDLLRMFLDQRKLDIPVVVQANKQDVVGAIDTQTMARRFATGADVPIVAAQADSGVGVRETAVLAIRAAANRVQTILRERGIESLAGTAETGEQLRARIEALEAEQPMSAVEVVLSRGMVLRSTPSSGVGQLPLAAAPTASVDAPPPEEPVAPASAPIVALATEAIAAPRAFAPEPPPTATEQVTPPPLPPEPVEEAVTAPQPQPTVARAITAPPPPEPAAPVARAITAPPPPEPAAPVARAITRPPPPEPAAPVARAITRPPPPDRAPRTSRPPGLAHADPPPVEALTPAPVPVAPLSAPPSRPPLVLPAVRPPMPTPDVASGFVWPSTTGRDVIRRVPVAEAVLRADLSGRHGVADGSGRSDALIYEAGIWCLKTSHRRRFADMDEARNALVQLARRKIHLGPMLVHSTALSLEKDAEGGLWLWTVTPWLTTLRGSMEHAAEHHDESRLGDALTMFAEVAVTSAGLAARHGILLDIHPSNFASFSDKIYYLDDDIGVGSQVPAFGHAVLRRADEYAEHPPALSTYVDALSSFLIQRITREEGDALELESAVRDALVHTDAGRSAKNEILNALRRLQPAPA
jgi:signal recognition particle receptor subunit beta